MAFDDDDGLADEYEIVNPDQLSPNGRPHTQQAMSFQGKPNHSPKNSDSLFFDFD